MKLDIEAAVIVVLAGALWFATRDSRAKCVDDGEAGFVLNLVDAGGETSWPSEGVLVVYTYGSVRVVAGKEGTFLHGPDNEGRIHPTRMMLLALLAATPFACEGKCPPPPEAELVPGRVRDHEV
jgi:hypothetical protein